ncbi:hypothetical protein RhiirA5_422062 [Rhizophagus irregularis]|uniref:Uncharacterized protein n=1 Tax=Rhizophagus irregularis TaxID=588596 RepID=A0A2I1FIL6_9GLOM|nr:hypothetical protein RhiirA5_422062 [Rhizophagus irregularis]PKY34236.1 hypothetical protein RhiirB3_453762 [Rhizophagus irregularis]
MLVTRFTKITLGCTHSFTHNVSIINEDKENVNNNISDIIQENINVSDTIQENINNNVSDTIQEEQAANTPLKINKLSIKLLNQDRRL